MAHSRLTRAAACGCASLTVGLLAGCVPGSVLTDRNTVKADTVAPIYYPTTQFDNYSCSQLTTEIETTNASIADMSAKLEKGEYDKSGTLVVTPFFLMYDNTKVMDETPKKAQELGRLKGTLVSLKEASAKGRCPA
jgi:hypothetical protein